MAFVELRESEHAAGIRPVAIHYRDAGRGRVVVFLHGGWGYGVYPIDRQIAAFGERVRFVSPDRSGYGGSTRVAGEMPTDFHRRAAAETLAVLDALGIERAIFWGHSDGAVIAAMIGLAAPERCERLILEAFHFYRNKPGSRGFFERFSAHPEDLAEETQRLLAADHGAEHWPNVLRRNCGAWIRIADESVRPEQDLYGGRLGELCVPTVFLHGAKDPRTQPGEMERVREVVPQAEFRFVKEGQHSPHSEEAVSEEVNTILGEFFKA
ncbi:MAG TPA: alpha/beta hydrolase [Candidatus Dormibacteraeota bacterium]|nr:alpha/beta hydrolase [Candidatus Dormibacteraeota bacterium]